MATLAFSPRGLERYDFHATKAPITHVLVISRARWQPLNPEQNDWLGDILKRCGIDRRETPKGTLIRWGHCTIPDFWLQNLATSEFGRSIWDTRYYTTEIHSFVDGFNAAGRVFVVRQHSEKRPKRHWFWKQ